MKRKYESDQLVLGSVQVVRDVTFYSLPPTQKEAASSTAEKAHTEVLQETKKEITSTVVQIPATEKQDETLPQEDCRGDLEKAIPFFLDLDKKGFPPLEPLSKEGQEAVEAMVKKIVHKFI